MPCARQAPSRSCALGSEREHNIGKPVNQVDPAVADLGKEIGGLFAQRVGVATGNLESERAIVAKLTVGALVLLGGQA